MLLQSLKSQIQEQAASETKRAQETAMRVQEEIDNKRKKIEEQMVADLEAKEKNKRQIIDERKAKFHKRLAAHVILLN